MSILNGQPPTAPVLLRTMGKVGMWGAPSSGKTTFLAALSIAANRQPAESLVIYGSDTESTEFLNNETARLTYQQQFPPATEANKHLSWVLQMEVEAIGRKWGFLPTTTMRPFQFNLDLLDEPGRVFADTPEIAGVTSSAAKRSAARLFGDEDETGSSPTAVAGDEDAFLDQLASCQALLLLFDPVREWREGTAFNYFHGTLMHLAQRLLPGRGGAKLPQFVAVCTTKFDHHDVYGRARDKGYRTFPPTDPHHFPRVSDALAERFFVDMVKESQRGNADLVRNALRHFFQRDRIKFFVTSAIGFHLDRQLGMFQESEFSNVVDQAGGNPRIRGPVYPINVIEPLMWLGECLAAEEG
jgi:hypothetical protein